MTSMAREAVTTSYITTKLRRIPNGLLGSNQRTSLSHEHLLPSFPLYIYIYIYILSRVPGYFAGTTSPFLRAWVKKMGNRSKSDHDISVAKRGCCESSILLSTEKYFFTSLTIFSLPSKGSDSTLYR